jgi:hypothetical protein
MIQELVPAYLTAFVVGDKGVADQNGREACRLAEDLIRQVNLCQSAVAGLDVRWSAENAEVVAALAEVASCCRPDDGEVSEALLGRLRRAGRRLRNAVEPVPAAAGPSLLEALPVPEDLQPLADPAGPAAREKPPAPPPIPPTRQVQAGPSGQSTIEEPAYRFELVGDIWHLRYGNEKGTIADTLKGLKCLARLLRSPHLPINALDLEGGDSTKFPAGWGKDAKVPQEVEAAYRERVRQLLGDRAEAEERQDQEEYDRIDAELQTIMDELKRAKGLGGRRRDNGPLTEAAQAHDRVEKALKAVYARLEQKGLPALAAHLKKHIRAEEPTFAYRPGVPAPDWKVAF